MKMENDDKPCCAAEALRRIKQVKIHGIATGITMLDACITAVRTQGLTSDAAISEALMKQVKVYNYVPPAAVSHYAEALMEEYRKSSPKQ